MWAELNDTQQYCWAQAYVKSIHCMYLAKPLYKHSGDQCVTEIYYTLVSLLSYFYDIWGLFYCNFILLEENEIFLSISILSILYTYSEFLVMSSDYITWISPPIGLYWLVVRCRWNINVHLTLCPLIRNTVCNNIN